MKKQCFGGFFTVFRCFSGFSRSERVLFLLRHRFFVILFDLRQQFRDRLCDAIVPKEDAIRAALYPENTNFYYYALDTETGLHKFFTNAYEFNNFVARQNY